jgi:hypothetical protein
MRVGGGAHGRIYICGGCGGGVWVGGGTSLCVWHQSMPMNAHVSGSVLAGALTHLLAAGEGEEGGEGREGGGGGSPHLAGAPLMLPRLPPALAATPPGVVAAPPPYPRQSWARGRWSLRPHHPTQPWTGWVGREAALEQDKCSSSLCWSE